MKFDSKLIAGVRTEARNMGIETAALLAVVEVESAGRVLIEGLCPIRIEGHYFHKGLKGSELQKASRQKLASPSAGAVKNPRSMKARYQKLERMMAINPNAALESCSWGIGQVMGSHWKSLGYRSVQELVNLCKSGVIGQIQVMARYIKVNNLIGYLKRHQWAKFAKAYNGPNYKKYKYHTKLANAYRKHSGARESTAKVVAKPEPSAAISELQTLLCQAGYHTTIDGFAGDGSHTDMKVKAFQRDHGLTVDGIAGEKTMNALRKAAAQVSKPKTGPKPAPKSNDTPQKQPTSKQNGIAGIFAAAIAAIIAAVGYFWDWITNLF